MKSFIGFLLCRSHAGKHGCYEFMCMTIMLSEASILQLIPLPFGSSIPTIPLFLKCHQSQEQGSDIDGHLWVSSYTFSQQF